MERITRFVPLALFCVYSMKIMTEPIVTFQEAMALVIFASLTGFVEYKSQEKAMKSMKEDIELLKKTVLDLDKQDGEIRNHVNGIKLGQNIRSASVNGNGTGNNRF